ncbi:MAG: cyclase family protein [Chloroflexota bacterium]|nr:cyclase family protein [Chloroflexota bacterium]
MAHARPLSRTMLDDLVTRCSNWGRWGPDDQRGTLNFLRPEQVRRAAALVRDGITVSCALPLATRPGPQNPFPVLHHMLGDGDLENASGATDWFALAPHGSTITHLDALCHIFYQGRMYNGRSASMVTVRGAGAGAIDTVRDGIVGRGVLLDIPRQRGVQWLEPGEAITVEDLERAAAAEGVALEDGDLLLVRTGRHARARAGVPPPPPPGPLPMLPLAGLEWTTLPWLHERKIALLGGDNYSDCVPSGFEGPQGLPIHTVGIVAMGLHLLDNADLEALAAACAERGRWEFQLIIAPLILEGGTASPVNPLAVF